VVQVLLRGGQDGVDGPEKCGKEEDSDDDDGGGGLNFFPRGRDHLAHLGANIFEEVEAAGEDTEGAIGNAVVGTHDCCFGHRLFLFRALLCDGHNEPYS